MTLAKRALAYATEAHGEQKRKYTGAPYIEHPIAVAKIVATVPHDEAMIAAAYLHDVVEDTPKTLADILAEFGGDVARLVAELTDISKDADGNRRLRKSIDRMHNAAASARGQTIKVADLIDNAIDIQANDPNFAVVYMREKSALLEVMTRADESLLKRAREIVTGYEQARLDAKLSAASPPTPPP